MERFTFVCDAPGCPERASFSTDREFIAKLQVRATGWRIVQDGKVGRPVCYCPSHASKPGEVPVHGVH